MFKTKFRKITVGLGIVALASAAILAGCTGGDTDGGSAGEEAAIGTQYVSDGGAGATLRIYTSHDQTQLPVTDMLTFWVTLLDPQGQPVPWVRIFCETEHGLAIIEPSHGGVAFEHTNSEGYMSGVIGGLTPGSFIMECRAPEGFNLVDRIQIHVTGEVPEGWNGWPNAAGGNLGGGVVIEPPDSTTMNVRILAFSGDADSVAHIDTVQVDCDPGAPIDMEPYGYDEYRVTLTNSTGGTINVEGVEFTVNQPGAVPVSEQATSLVIEPGETASFVGPFTEDLTGYKVYAGTTVPVLNGTWQATFTVTGTSDTGDSFVESAAVTFTAGNVNNCN